MADIKFYKNEIWWGLAASVEAVNFEETLLDTDTSSWSRKTWEINERRFEKARDEIHRQIMRKVRS